MFFLGGFGKFLGEERAICGVTSNVEAIKCAAFDIFMKGVILFRLYPPSGLKMTKHWYKAQINNTLVIGGR